jgi:hypothetical protein
MYIAFRDVTVKMAAVSLVNVRGSVISKSKSCL